MSNCKGIFGLVFGHKYQPRITLGPSVYNTSGVRARDYIVIEMANLYRQQTYHGDVCKRCGDIVNG